MTKLIPLLALLLSTACALDAQQGTQSPDYGADDKASQVKAPATKGDLKKPCSVSNDLGDCRNNQTEYSCTEPVQDTNGDGANIMGSAHPAHACFPTDESNQIWCCEP